MTRAIATVAVAFLAAVAFIACEEAVPPDPAPAPDPAPTERQATCDDSAIRLSGKLAEYDVHGAIVNDILHMGGATAPATCTDPVNQSVVALPGDRTEQVQQPQYYLIVIRYPGGNRLYNVRIGGERTCIVDTNDACVAELSVLGDTAIDGLPGDIDPVIPAGKPTSSPTPPNIDDPAGTPGAAPGAAPAPPPNLYAYCPNGVSTNPLADFPERQRKPLHLWETWVNGISPTGTIVIDPCYQGSGKFKFTGMPDWVTVKPDVDYPNNLKLTFSPTADDADPNQVRRPRPYKFDLTVSDAQDETDSIAFPVEVRVWHPWVQCARLERNWYNNATEHPADAPPVKPDLVIQPNVISSRHFRTGNLEVECESSMNIVERAGGQVIRRFRSDDNGVTVKHYDRRSLYATYGWRPKVDSVRRSDKSDPPEARVTAVKDYIITDLQDYFTGGLKPYAYRCSPRWVLITGSKAAYVAAMQPVGRYTVTCHATDANGYGASVSTTAVVPEDTQEAWRDGRYTWQTLHEWTVTLHMHPRRICQARLLRLNNCWYGRVVNGSWHTYGEPISNPFAAGIWGRDGGKWEFVGDNLLAKHFAPSILLRNGVLSIRRAVRRAANDGGNAPDGTVFPAKITTRMVFHRYCRPNKVACVGSEDALVPNN